MRLYGPAGQTLHDHIAEVAARLFYQNGIGAVGVDRIAGAAQITKRTLYRHYRSKDELIAASLRRAPLVRFPTEGDPIPRIVGAFEAMAVFLGDTAYRGCPFIFYSAELIDRSHAARRIIERRLQKRRAWFRDRAAEAGLADPERVAERLDVLFDGALASSAKRGDVVAARTALDLVHLVLQQAIPQRPALRAS